jgi:cellulose synthase/poly-beta-1,6-N-acetylglucosamine synthase-like glycosyltransferase
MSARASIRADFEIDPQTSPLPAPGRAGDGEFPNETIITIGICAYNEAHRISQLFGSLVTQSIPSGFVLAEILVVASGCTDGTERVVENWAKIEPRIALIHESERHGKAHALNMILGRYRGDLLVLVNADARLRAGALSELLHAFDRNSKVELACGFPVPEPSESSIVSLVEDVWWRLHNRTLHTLAGLGGGNHCCDEFMGLKRGIADSIPGDVVNDGAYLSVLAARKGITTQFVPGATVFVETPSHLLGLFRQRLRIVRGHRQVVDILGQAPYTLEGLARRRPALAARIILTEFSSRPFRTLAFLFVVMPIEGLAQATAAVERAFHQRFPSVWPKVE